MLGTSIGLITLLGELESNLSLKLSKSIGNIFLNPRFRLDATFEIGLYAQAILTPLSVVSNDPFHDPVWVAVEIDVYDDTTPLTIRLCNRGTVKRTVSGVLYQYDPRIKEMPIELGTTISVTSYGSPVRGTPNGGLIRFAIDELIWGWFVYRWNGQPFRVYYGLSVNPVEADVDNDLELVYVGRIASIKHDTVECSLQTTDETIKWDDPLTTDFFDGTFPKAIRDKPKPQLWGYAFSIEPVIINEASQIYAVSYRTGGLDSIEEVRVGGIPWNMNTVGPPIQGEWTPDLPNGTFTLGSPPLGMDVRCDARQGNFTVAGILESMVVAAGGTVDSASMAALDTALPAKISYYSTTSSVNRLDAIDDFVTNAGCWWSVGPLGKVIAGVIDVPATTATRLFDEKTISSLELNTVHAPAWRIRVGYQKNWSPETSFASSVLQTEQAKWKEDVQIYNPHYENATIKTFEPLAVDVPTLQGSFVSQNDALPVQQRLTKAWGTVRSLFDMKAFVDPRDITLYDTVAVNYMMVTGNFRITSAIRAIGGGPATFQLWGTIGPYAVQQPILLPQTVFDMGIWIRTSGSGTFDVGIDCPSNVTRLWVRGCGAGGGGAGGIISGGFLYTGGGGGAGGYFEDVITVTASSSIAYDIGVGGTGMAFGSFGTADDGGDTTFGGATGNGGTGGRVQILDIGGGLGGGASGATVAINGGPGDTGHVKIVGSVADVYSGNGGSSPFGGGGAATLTFSPGGAPGTGGGAHATEFSAASNPGNDGIVIVVWFQ